jgi:pSer/pThr/pTyr-binding forkhead associated (FHA) protein
MDIFWSTLLFSAKWLFISLIYLILFVVLMTVRREMRLQVAGKLQAPSAAAGRLKIIEPGSDPHARRGAVLALQNETTIGVESSNDLVLADRFISARHACLRWDGVEWWLEDLGSKNGTRLNGRPLLPHREQTVPFGATVGIGDMVFELVE